MADATTSTTDGPSIAVRPDRMQAVLRIPRNARPSAVSLASLKALAEEIGLTVAEDVEALLLDAVHQFNAQPRDLRIVVAQGVRPQHGGDGNIEWVDGYAPPSVALTDDDPQPQPQADDGNDDPIDFYAQSAFHTVGETVHVATLIRPTPGVPGFDVFGQRIPPRAGRPHPLRPHPSIEIAPDGRVFTVNAGLLSADRFHIVVHPVLRVDDSVDFSTGNIDFDGSVMIHGGVRGKFKVDCTGDLIIAGLVEAAHIRCGGQLRAEGGMAGREIGTLEIARDTVARYLVGVSGRIGGALAVKREVINCRLDVAGNLELRGGDLIGSQANIQGAVHIGTLGSDAGVATTLRLGYVPELTEQLNKMHELLPRLTEHVEQLRQQLREINERPDLHDNMTQAHRGNLSKGIGQLEAKRQRLRERYGAAAQQFDQRCRVDLTVYRTIHPGVTIVLPRRELRFFEPLHGPLTLRRMPDGKLHIQASGGHAVAINDVARVTNTATY